MSERRPRFYNVADSLVALQRALPLLTHNTKVVNTYTITSPTIHPLPNNIFCVVRIWHCIVNPTFTFCDNIKYRDAYDIHTCVQTPCRHRLQKTFFTLYRHCHLSQLQLLKGEVTTWEKELSRDTLEYPQSVTSRIFSIQSVLLK